MPTLGEASKGLHYELQYSGRDRHSQRDRDDRALADCGAKTQKLKKKFIAALLRSKPIEPKHQRPTTIGEGWGVYKIENSSRTLVTSQMS